MWNCVPVSCTNKIQDKINLKEICPQGNELFFVLFFKYNTDKISYIYIVRGDYSLIP